MLHHRGENKDADQLRSNCTADLHLYFCYLASTISLLLKSIISMLLRLYRPICVGPGRKPSLLVFTCHVQAEAGLVHRSFSSQHIRSTVGLCVCFHIAVNIPVYQNLHHTPRVSSLCVFGVFVLPKRGRVFLVCFFHNCHIGTCLPGNNIRILHECQVWIDKSVPRVTRRAS